MCVLSARNAGPSGPTLLFVAGEQPGLEDDLDRPAARGIGALNWLPDRDQVVRRVPILLGLDGKLVPNPYTKWSDIDSSLPDVDSGWKKAERAPAPLSPPPSLADDLSFVRSAPLTAYSDFFPERLLLRRTWLRGPTSRGDEPPSGAGVETELGRCTLASDRECNVVCES